MSLLLLLAGGEVQAGDDRTFEGTWEQAAAGWEAVAVQLNAEGAWVQNQSWSATMTGPGVAPPEGLSEFPMQVERLIDRQILAAKWVQPSATWRAEMDFDDDEIVLTELDVL